MADGGFVVGRDIDVEKADGTTSPLSDFKMQEFLSLQMESTKKANGGDFAELMTLKDLLRLVDG